MHQRSKNKVRLRLTEAHVYSTSPYFQPSQKVSLMSVLGLLVTAGFLNLYNYYFGPDNSLLWMVFLCIIGCLTASLFLPTGIHL